MEGASACCCLRGNQNSSHKGWRRDCDEKRELDGSGQETKWKIYLTCVSKDQIANLDILKSWYTGQKDVFGIRWKEDLGNIVTIEVS